MGQTITPRLLAAADDLRATLRSRKFFENCENETKTRDEDELRSQRSVYVYTRLMELSPSGVRRA